MILLRIKALITIFLVIFSFTIINFPLANAYPGDGDCQNYHNITPIEVPIDNSANIILDGVPSEEFWSKSENQMGKVVIPLASIRYDSNPPDLLIYMNATFIMNTNSLYILCEWMDNTTSAEYYVADGILFCWNINVVNFSAYYPSGMSTEHMGGGRVDSWRWYHYTSISSGIPTLCYDECFEDNGWVNPNPELSQVNAAFKAISNVSYTLEISRSLITNEEYDVQFNQNKGYLFNMAIFDNDLHENHAISWTYSLDLDFGTLPPSIPGYFNIIMFLAMIGIIATFQKKRLKMIK